MSRSKGDKTCGCWLCKPWKHGKGKTKPSDKKREDASKDYNIEAKIND